MKSVANMICLMYLFYNVVVVAECCGCYCCHRVCFSMDPDTHVEAIKQAEEIVLEGTSHWSCKIAITGSSKRTFRAYR